MSTDESNSKSKTPMRVVIPLLWIAVAIALLMAWKNQPPSANSEDSPKIDDSKSDVQTKPKWNPNGIEDFSFTERSGQTVTKQDLLGKPWVVSFVFTRCAGPCPLITGQFRKLQDTLIPEDGSDPGFRFVTLTVDPKRDTPETLTKYAELFKANKNYWLFLTGDQQEIHHLIQESFQNVANERKGPERKKGFEFDHTSNAMLVDETGRVRAKFSLILSGAVNDTGVVRLRRTLKQIQSGASVDEALEGG